MGRSKDKMKKFISFILCLIILISVLPGTVEVHAEESVEENEEYNRYYIQCLQSDGSGFGTGNINFDGSLRIRGNVENGTEVHVTEDLEIDGNVGAATIICGGNILLKKGMNSAGHGYIKAEKGIVSRFFEAVKVEASEDIQVNIGKFGPYIKQGNKSKSLTGEDNIFNITLI